MSPAELQRSLQAVEPAAVLVTSGVLDKIIRQTLKLPGWMWHVPHRRTWIVDRQYLFRYVEQEDLLLPADRLLPATVLLLETPTRAQEGERAEALLLTYWRRLFHVTVDLELTNPEAAQKWTPAAIDERIARLGQTEFEEIRAVLVQDKYLTPGADARAVYLEFVAVFLEDYYFARPLLDSHFPGIRDVEATRRMLEEDLDGRALFERTRLPGAPEPGLDISSSPHEAHEFFYDLVGESDRAAQSGNLVRAAIQRTRAARVAPAAQAFDTRKQAAGLLEKLLERMQPALEIPPDELSDWRRHLPELLDKADQGSQPAEAYLLFDLQKVCVDFEREIYTLDLVEWLLSGFKKPVRRPLSSQRLVRVTRHLRSAAQRLTMARLSESDRKDFAGLLQAALARCEDRVRQRFRPILTSALEDVGLDPRDPHGRTAFLKLIEELLDRILAYGFLTFSDLRDALARNRLKLPDLSDPQDFIGGDPLLRLDRRLATLLDGVYRRGEIYLRLLERFTALNFGTALGRLVTQFVTIPFVAAFLVLEAVTHFILHPVGAPDMPAYAYWTAFLALGVFVLSLVHSAEVRRLCADVGWALWRGLRVLVVDVPMWLVRNPTLKQVVTSWTFQLLYWYIVKPLVLCALLWLIVPETFSNLLQAALAFLAANFLINSRPGQEAAESISHGLLRFFALLRGGLIPGLVRFFVQLFKHALHTMEAVLFAVDEWLRFRGGDTRLAMAIRSILGVVWFPIAYLARFNMVVLIEPGLNPVKFPVCSLAAKVIYPTYIHFQPWVMESLTPILGPVVTWAVVTWTLFWLPDVFGFLFFEMKDNWRLYRANLSPTPMPVPVGAHGETVSRLLQPGFHSGTIPKLFARLRHAERHAHQTGNYAAARTVRATLEEVEEAVRLFVTRELVVLLEQDRAWRKETFAVGAVQLATNRIGVELCYRAGGASPPVADAAGGTGAVPREPLWLEFEEHAGVFTARATAPSWLAELSAPERRALDEALTLLWKLAGADGKEAPDDSLALPAAETSSPADEGLDGPVAAVEGTVRRTSA